MRNTQRQFLSDSTDKISGRIVLIVAGGDLANIVINRFTDSFSELVVLRELPETKVAVIRRRWRLLGPWQAFSQVAAGALTRILGRLSKLRLDRICRQYSLKRSDNGAAQIIEVPSVNSDECREALRRLSPAVVAVYGTRIIGSTTLACVNVPFINYHAGINPKYRGQHPAYWALVNNDKINAGVTIHLVDEGVDTGSIIVQARVAFETSDNISTYQFVQMAVALPLFISAMEAALHKRIEVCESGLESKQWFPPTLEQYIYNGLTKGVW